MSTEGELSQIPAQTVPETRTRVAKKDPNPNPKITAKANRQPVQ